MGNDRPLNNGCPQRSLLMRANSTVTDAGGTFSFNVPAGNYTVTAVKSGFLPAMSAAMRN